MMDAVDEKDVVLQRAASDLMDHFKSSLPRFLWHSTAIDCGHSEQKRHTRNIVRTSTTLDLIKLVGCSTCFTKQHILIRCDD